MHLTFRNVNDAFRGLVEMIHKSQLPLRQTDSRNGPAIVIDEPLTVTYKCPRERVLFNLARDCNPFFHLFESLWMLAGRNDVKPLAYYNGNIGNYSDNGQVFNSAYGYRWRKRWEVCEWQHSDQMVSKPVDQLSIIANHLRAKPESRRAVLQVWDVTKDLLKIDTTKDNACNTHAYFSLRECSKDEEGACAAYDLHKNGCPWYLDMTVCNRSNDLIWGMLGANAVHWSMLQEYLANRIGVDVGLYHQFSNNVHVYLDKWQPDAWLSSEVEPRYERDVWVWDVPLVQDAKRFDCECTRFIDCIDGTFEEPFLRDVAQPMMAAFRRHKRRQYLGDEGAFELISRVAASDWRLAGKAWLERRHARWNNAGAASAEERS